jgi:hypothetical protein
VNEATVSAVPKSDIAPTRRRVSSSFATRRSADTHRLSSTINTHERIVACASSLRLDATLYQSVSTLTRGAPSTARSEARVFTARAETADRRDRETVRRDLAK